MSGSLVLSGGSKLPAHIMARQSNYAGNSMAVSDFKSTPRISLKGNKFSTNVGGDTKRLGATVDVVIVGAIPGVQRLAYGGRYDPANPSGPECWSSDNKTPDANVPSPKASRCSTCPANEKGSGNDGKSRACKFTKRMAVIIDGDETLTVYQLDVNSSSIFGDDKASRNLYSAKSFGEMLDNRRLDPALLVVRLSFDDDVDTPSKLFFEPVRFLEEDELGYIEDGINKDSVASTLVLVSSPPKKKGELATDDTPVQEAAAAQPKGFGKKATPVVDTPADDAPPAKPKGGFGGKPKPAVAASDPNEDAPPAKPASVTKVKAGELDGALDALLGDLDM